MRNDAIQKQVTVLVRHTLKTGKEAVFEAWLMGVEGACQSFTGFIGTELIKTLDAGEQHYVCIFRFDNFANLEKWMRSKERIAWLSKSRDFTDSQPQYVHYKHHGMNILMGKDREGHGDSPIQIICLSIIGLALPVHFVPPVVSSFVGMPAAATLISLAIIVPSMVFIIMPVLLRVLGRWLA